MQFSAAICGAAGARAMLRPASDGEIGDDADDTRGFRSATAGWPRCAACRSRSRRDNSSRSSAPTAPARRRCSRRCRARSPPGAGRITYDGHNLLAVPPPERVHLGIAHVPEGRQVFAAMTVLENLEMGAYSTRGRADWQRNHRPHFHALSGPRRAPRAAGRHAFGRRAADAGDRPRHRLGTAAPAARRAVDGSRADDRRSDLRPDCGAAPRG